MIRTTAVIALIVVNQTAWPQMRYCEPFAPTTADIDQLLELTPEIPKHARLASACYGTSQQLISPQNLSTIRHNIYRFSWPTGEVVSGVQFHRALTCRHTESLAPDCTDPERRADWQGTLVSYQQDIDSIELVQLLTETDRLIPTARAISSVDRTYVSHRGDRFAAIRRYRVVAVLPGHKYMYTLERECSSFSECEWMVSQTQKYYDPVY